MNEITYVMRLTIGSAPRGRAKLGLMVSEVRRIGQRYTESSPTILEHIWEPRGIFEVRDLRWCVSLNAARRYIKTLPSARSDQAVFADLTFTGSAGGPGFYPLSKDAGPFFAIVDFPVKLDPLNPIFTVVAKLK